MSPAAKSEIRNNRDQIERGCTIDLGPLAEHHIVVFEGYRKEMPNEGKRPRSRKRAVNPRSQTAEYIQDEGDRDNVEPKTRINPHFSELKTSRIVG